MPLYDANNLENCLAFLDAKRKLRIVLGAADFQVSYQMQANITERPHLFNVHHNKTMIALWNGYKSSVEVLKKTAEVKEMLLVRFVIEFPLMCFDMYLTACLS